MARRVSELCGIDIIQAPKKSMAYTIRAGSWYTYRTKFPVPAGTLVFDARPAVRQAIQETSALAIGPGPPFFSSSRPFQIFVHDRN